MGGGWAGGQGGSSCALLHGFTPEASHVPVVLRAGLASLNSQLRRQRCSAWLQWEVLVWRPKISFLWVPP